VAHLTRRSLSATVVADRYHLQREIARGGMGTVWLARDEKLGRTVAVKVMAQELARLSEALQRFEREAMAVAGLTSAHVVQVYDYGIQEGLPFIVMELLEGENLGQRLRRVPKVPLADARRIVTEMCKGLKAAHAASLIHRDLKPSNIFLARRDDVEVVKLLDFGVVKTLDRPGSDEATVTGILLGTPQYMSPEQARALRDIDARSDLWSVATIAFRMITGVNPFQGDSVGDVVLKICSDALPHVREHAPELPVALDAFFARAFGRHPRDRFQTADELAQAFAGIAAPVPLHHTPAPATPPPATPSQPNQTANQSAPNPAFISTQPLTVTTAREVEAARAPFLSSPSSPGMPGMPSQPSLSLPPPRASQPSLVSSPQFYESTPVSTTVGGTQLAPMWSRPPRQMSGRAVAAIVGGAATLITLLLVVGVWLGSDSTGTPATAGAPPVAAVPAPTLREEPAVVDLDEPDVETPRPVSAASATASSAEPPKPKPAVAKDSQPVSGPLPPRPRPDPQPAPSPKPGRPDWGLGEH
jgi:eukaryotic-like serine/threonine-protein kinase